MSGDLIRERGDADLDGCVALLRDVHAADGYPVNWPEDPRGWLAPPELVRPGHFPSGTR
ncbi:hypothetical protein [Actinoplanes couchii]|uniref:hypothetical protein n=1 Tax=Actinoplanes couchii TaxID=403638 RepID=UPI0027DAF00A|nr:hypothetical protein [Actinoplanes couchii]MDR6326186.1 hypothetical protein [Actinoplanes couchii]